MAPTAVSTAAGTVDRQSLLRPLVFATLLYALAYAAAQELGLALVVEPVAVALYWPPAGLAIATFAIVRPRLLPGLIAAQFAVNVAGNMLHGSAWRPSMVFGVANLIAPLLIAALVRRTVRGRRMIPPSTSPDLLLLLVAAWVAVAVGALLGSIGQQTIGDFDGSLWMRWRGWWAADAAGIVALTPLLITVASGRYRLGRRRTWELALVLVVLPLVTVAVFWHTQPFGLSALRTLVLVALLWPAMRLGLFGVSLVLAPVVTIVVVLTGNAHGPFAAASSSVQAVLDAQVFLLGTALAALVIGATTDTIRRGTAVLAAREGLRAAALRTARINALATRLTGAVTRRQIVQAVTQSSAEVVGAVQASLMLARPSATSAGGDGSDGSDATDRTAGGVSAIAVDGPADEARRTGTMVLVPDRDQMAQYPTALAHAEAAGIQALACVPLQTIESSVPAGVLVIGWDRPQDFEPDVRGALLLLGEIITQAVARAELFEIESSLRRRAEGLEAVATALTRAVTVSDVARTAIDVGLRAVSSPGVVLRVDDGRLHVLAPEAPEFLPFVQDYQGLPISSRWPVARAAREGRTITVDSLDHMRRDYPEAADRMERLSLHWLVAVPVSVRGQVSAVITAGSWNEGRSGDELVGYVEALADLVGQAFERAEQYETQHEIAEVLQRSMLTDVPDRSDISLAAHYGPSVDRLEVGGDWFDAFAGDDDQLVLVVGDVVGRGLEAATTMGQLRSATRALAVHLSSPGALMSALDRYVMQTPSAMCATVACASLDPRTGAVTYALAGHPPPLVLAVDGSTRFLGDGLRSPLGVPNGDVGRATIEATTVLEEGDRLILFSDGLVERRGETIDVGLERLCEAVKRVRALHGDEFIAAVLTEIGEHGGQDDDVCVLVAERVLARAHLDVVVRRPEDLRTMRAQVLAWIDGLIEDDGSFERQGVQDLVLALDELCSNGIEHGLRGDDGRPEGVSVSLVYDGLESVTARVTDPGRWILPDGRSGGGRGLAIVRAVSDHVSIAQDSGTTVVLRKRLPIAVD